MNKEARPPRFAAVFAVREFRMMWSAELLSICGDQIARVALSVLVYDRTSSATLTGLTYALTYFPSFIGGILLSGLADRYPRREVMAGVDLLRAVLIALVAVPGMPLAGAWVLIALVSFVNPPFKAAQLALLPDVLGDELYVAGLSIRSMTNQSAQLAGFAGGGLLLTTVNPSVGLLIDALTFVASALAVRFGLRARPAASGSSDRPSFLRSSVTGARTAFSDAGSRALLFVIWLMGLIPVYEGLAAPYAVAVGGGTVAVGLLLASDPFGSVIAAFLFGRLSMVTQERMLATLTVLTGVPLLVTFLHPGLVVSIVLFAVTGGIGTVVVIQATATLSQRVPDESRAQTMGLSNTGLTTTMGLSPLLGGVLSDQTSPAVAVGWFGVAGVVLALPLAVAWQHATAQRLANDANH